MIRASDILHSSSLPVQPSSYNKIHLHTANHFLSFHVLVFFFFFFLFFPPTSLSSKEQYAILELLINIIWALVSVVWDEEAASMFWRTTSTLPFLSYTALHLPSFVSLLNPESGAKKKKVLGKSPSTAWFHKLRNSISSQFCDKKSKPQELWIYRIITQT